MRSFAILAALLLVIAGCGGQGGRADRAEVVPVVVAAESIPAGTEIREGMVRVVEMPPESVITGAFPDARSVVGQPTRIAIAEGEQVSAAKLGQLSSYPGNALP